jgi:alkanesulfonate monooxygenase SsuD/methylene tetrahydromethanopterin reductase-like flavin-dependent oxidoreductase (luciferase family)
MRFGVWYDFRNPPRWHRPPADLYAETLEQAAWAETLGFESIWLSEHHVTDEGYLPATLPMLAALAMRTRVARLGTAVILAPFQHPIRFAEDVAVVDQLSRGRLEIGVAPGYRVEEFAALGVDPRERGTRTDELVEVARLAWTGEPFSHRGRHWSFENVQVTPVPFQRPGPPILIGGASVPAARRAGRLGCHFTPDSFAPPAVFDAYGAALRAHGHDPKDFPIATNRMIYVTEDPDAGWEEVREHVLYVHNRYRAWFAAAGDHTASGPPLEDAGQLPRDEYLVGTPAQVIAGIEAMRRRLPFDRLYFWAGPPGLSIERSSRSLELFARHVIPHFSPHFSGAAG